MRLLILLIPFLQVGRVESLNEVSGYLGHSVTLPSGGNPSWNLSIIEWSILSNNTWIATYRSGRENTERIHQYTGRLSLNNSSGDLTIHNLTRDDAMEYNVDLINTERQSSANKIKLTVKQHLRKPTIEILFHKSAEKGCWMGLQCISADEDVDFSWQVQPPGVIAVNMSSLYGKSGVISAYFISTQTHFQITCNSRRNTEIASTVVTQKCDDGKSHPHQQAQCRNRCGLCVFIGFLMGVLGIVIIYVYREATKHIQSA